jgi:hypothetical protein
MQYFNILIKNVLLNFKNLNFKSYFQINFEKDKTTNYVEFHFKDIKVLETWYGLFKTINLKHEQRYAGNHEFSLSSFGRETKKCNLCSAFFCGIFFQGYKCGYCDLVVHLNCLSSSDLKTCDVNHLLPKRPSHPEISFSSSRKAK